MNLHLNNKYFDSLVNLHLPLLVMDDWQQNHVEDGWIPPSLWCYKNQHRIKTKLLLLQITFELNILEVSYRPKTHICKSWYTYHFPFFLLCTYPSIQLQHLSTSMGLYGLTHIQKAIVPGILRIRSFIGVLCPVGSTHLIASSQWSELTIADATPLAIKN